MISNEIKITKKCEEWDMKVYNKFLFSFGGVEETTKLK